MKRRRAVAFNVYQCTEARAAIHCHVLLRIDNHAFDLGVWISPRGVYVLRVRDKYRLWDILVAFLFEPCPPSRRGRGSTRVVAWLEGGYPTHRAVAMEVGVAWMSESARLRVSADVGVSSHDWVVAKLADLGRKVRVPVFQRRGIGDDAAVRRDNSGVQMLDVSKQRRGHVTYAAAGTFAHRVYMYGLSLQVGVSGCLPMVHGVEAGVQGCPSR